MFDPVVSSAGTRTLRAVLGASLIVVFLGASQGCAPGGQSGTTGTGTGDGTATGTGSGSTSTLPGTGSGGSLDPIGGASTGPSAPTTFELPAPMQVMITMATTSAIGGFIVGGRPPPPPPQGAQFGGFSAAGMAETTGTGGAGTWGGSETGGGRGQGGGRGPGGGRRPPRGGMRSADGSGCSTGTAAGTGQGGGTVDGSGTGQSPGTGGSAGTGQSTNPEQSGAPSGEPPPPPPVMVDLVSQSASSATTLTTGSSVPLLTTFAAPGIDVPGVPPGMPAFRFDLKQVDGTRASEIAPGATVTAVARRPDGETCASAPVTLEQQ